MLLSEQGPEKPALFVQTPVINLDYLYDRRVLYVLSVPFKFVFFASPPSSFRPTGQTISYV